MLKMPSQPVWSFVVTDYQDTSFENKTSPDFSKELQLDLGEKTINQFEDIFKDIENVFWNGPLGAYDHPACSYYAEGSLELAKLLFQMALTNPNMSVVIGGGGFRRDPEQNRNHRIEKNDQSPN